MDKLIYIADDEKNIRDLICTFLINDGFLVKAFETGDDLLKEFSTNAADMIILDIMMPGTDGLKICSEIRKISNVPIIFVSAKNSELDKITGITTGSDDYMVKPFSPMELVARVKSIFRRINFETPKTLTYGDITLNISTREALHNDMPLELTPTEFSFLTYMFEHQNRAISRDELLKNVWKFDINIDTRATDDVLKRLRKKLGDSNVFIDAVWGFGFKLSIGGEK